MTPRQQWHDRIERTGMGDVTEYLESWDRLRQMNNLPSSPADWKYKSFEDLVLKAGSAYTYIPDLPEGVERGPMKECFANALHAVIRNDDLLYVEGYASGILPVHHAWVTADKRHAIEVTWEHGGDYHGIAFKTEWVTQHMLKKGTYGVFDWMVNKEFIENGMPRGALA